MSILTGCKIIEEVNEGNITISPFNVNKVGPNSYDLSLGDKLLTYAPKPGYNGIEPLDPRRENKVNEIIIPEDGVVLMPNKLYLGTTIERNGSDRYIPMLHGRSSAARLGIQVHASAGFGDLGWYGQWTLEITAVEPVRVYAGMSLCQVAFETIDGDVIEYSGKYQNQVGPISSRIWMDF